LSQLLSLAIGRCDEVYQPIAAAPPRNTQLLTKTAARNGDTNRK